MIGLFTVQLLLEQQKGNLALIVLSTLEKIFPHSQIIRSQVGVHFMPLVLTSSLLLPRDRSHWRTMG
jgi:hypothetical protein